jgi:hypothetical protein
MAATQQLPPVEETPLLVLRFSPRASPRLVVLVAERLQQEGLRVLLSRTSAAAAARNSDATKNGAAAPDRRRRSGDGDGGGVITATATQAKLEEAAEAIHLVKRTVDGVMERFTVSERRRFLRPSADKPPDTSSPSSSSPIAVDSHGLFTAGDWSLLAQRLWEQIKVIPEPNGDEAGDRDGSPQRQETELSRLLVNEYQVDCRVRVQIEDDRRQDLANLSARRVQALLRHQEQSDHLGHALRAHGLLESVSAAHLPRVRDRIFLGGVARGRLAPRSDEIQAYYGCDVAFYFEWMGFLSRWLVVPGVAGVAVYACRWHRGDTLDEDEYTPLYGLLTFFWAVLFLRFWERHEKRLSYRWGTYMLTDYERQKFFSTRDSFQGYLRLSPITGEPEVFYPAVRRRIKYVGSALITSLMLSVAFAVMVLSLNLQGYIRPKSNPARWNESSPHPFHFASLAALAEEGSLFDAASTWRSLVPPVIHAACINALNKGYRTVAGSLTSWENHETEHGHNNSYALKRFLFEAFDCYIALFYLAFYERDVERLKAELITVFQIDTFRRVACECVLPMLLQRVTGSRIRPGIPTGARRDGSPPSPLVPTERAILEDLEKDEYDEFDDYMEILIQFGYTTLFASAYPLASLVSVAANWVEVRSDLFKLSFLDRRPFPGRGSGLGIWRSLLSCLVWASALTNCLLAGFTSDQLMHYLPSFYLHDRSGYTTLEHDRGWLLIFVIFGLERLLLVGGMLVYAIVPGVPEDVTDELERRHFVHARRAAEARQASLRLKKTT